MIARVLHAVAPLQVAVDKHPLASVLAEIASLPDPRAGREHVGHALDRAAQDAGLDVGGLLVAHGQRARHAKLEVEFPGRVCVDVEGGAGALLVACDRCGLAAADNDEVGGRVDALEVFGREVLG